MFDTMQATNSSASLSLNLHTQCKEKRNNKHSWTQPPKVDFTKDTLLGTKYRYPHTSIKDWTHHTEVLLCIYSCFVQHWPLNFALLNNYLIHPPIKLMSSLSANLLYTTDMTMSHIMINKLTYSSLIVITTADTVMLKKLSQQFFLVQKLEPLNSVISHQHNITGACVHRVHVCKNR